MREGFISKLRNKFKSFTSIFLALLAITFLFSLLRTIPKISGAKKSIEEARLRVENLKKENEELEKQLETAKSQVYIEKQLRDKLGLAKEGEIIVILPDADTLRKLAPEIPEEEETLPDPTWRKWMKLFF